MKKLIALTLVLVMLLTLAACGGNGGTAPPANNSPTPTQNESPAPTPPDNSGDPGASTNGNGGSADNNGDSFFPGIHDSLVPDVMKIIVGTLDSATIENFQLIVDYKDCTEDDWHYLSQHFKDDSDFLHQNDPNEILLDPTSPDSIQFFVFDWDITESNARITGSTVRMSSLNEARDNGRITLTVKVNSQQGELR